MTTSTATASDDFQALTSPICKSLFSELYYEPDYESVLIIWQGNVTEAAYKEAMLGAKKLIVEDGVRALVVDERKLRSFTPGSRFWMIHKQIPEVLPKLRQEHIRFAIVAPQSIFAKTLAKMLHKGVKLIMPNIEMKYFDELEDAMVWAGRKYL